MLENALKSIRRISWISIAVVTILVTGIAIIQNYKSSPWEATRLNSIIGLLGAASFSAAMPILFRTLGFHKSIKEKGMTIRQFKRMKLYSVYSVVTGSLFAIYSCVIPVYRYHMYLAVLLGIYGIYSIIPVSNNYRQDIKGFGVMDE